MKQVIIDKHTDLNCCSLQELKHYEPYRITDSTAIPAPVPVIKINGEVLATEGNIITISGASKSGKSAFASWIISGAISLDGVINDPLESLEVLPNFDKKAVIHIDTEQARHKHQYNIKSILKRNNLENCPEHFCSYNLRQEDFNKYEDLTKGICETASKEFGGIHLIVVDGIADYISDVNDPSQSNAIIKYFEELAISYSTPIVLIVHTNPGSEKERGHLGSQLQRKSESVLTIKCEGDVSYLEPKFLRMAGKSNIPLLQFKYDIDKGYHISCGIRSTEKENKDLKRIEEYRRIAQLAFAPPISLGYGDAINSIMVHSNKQERTAKSMLPEMVAHKILIKSANNHYSLNIENKSL